MFAINPFKETKEWNERDLVEYPGLRFHYSKVKISVSIAFSLCILIFSFYGFFVLEGSLFRFLYLLFIIYLLRREIELLKRLMLKNPIFIVDKTRLYYIKTNKWYDLKRHTFENRIKSRYDWDGTFSVIDPMEDELVTESNWYLSEEDSLFAAIKYYKSQYHLNKKD